VTLVPGQDGDELCYQALDIGDIDGDGDIDIIAAFDGVNEENDPNKELEIWFNPGGEMSRYEEEFVSTDLTDEDDDGELDTCVLTVTQYWTKGVILERMHDLTDVEFCDVDQNGALDAVSVTPSSSSYKLTWLENLGNSFGTADWHPIGENDNGLDQLLQVDFDGDGENDILAYSEAAHSVHWFNNPGEVTEQYFPWEVYNIAQLIDEGPLSMSFGDLNNDGISDVVLSFGKQINWYMANEGVVTNPWSEFLLSYDDGGAEIRSVWVVDLDGDGLDDVVAALDRDGTEDDRLVWFHNLGY